MIGTGVRARDRRRGGAAVTEDPAVLLGFVAAITTVRWRLSADEVRIGIGCLLRSSGGRSGGKSGIGSMSGGPTSGCASRGTPSASDRGGGVSNGFGRIRRRSTFSRSVGDLNFVAGHGRQVGGVYPKTPTFTVHSVQDFELQPAQDAADASWHDSGDPMINIARTSIVFVFIRDLPCC